MRRSAERHARAPLAALNQRATYMFQHDALLPWKTVRQNVALGLILAAPLLSAAVHVSRDLGLLAFNYGVPKQSPAASGVDVALVRDGRIARLYTMLTTR